ncbi:MAG TPA: LLM class F420-dependent oxidoreductase [Trebonia sp.]
MYQYPDLTGLEGDMLDSGPAGEVARVAEEAGWDGFAFTEHPAPGLRWLETGGHQTLDPFVALGYVAAVTSRLKLLTYLSVLPYRNPMLLAKAAASVDILSGGRFILGVGTGYSKSEFHAVGIDFEERNVLFDEALEVLPLHWSGEPFSYTGRHFSARDVIARPRPPQQPIPIWIGGNSKLTRRRVAQRANGWMPMLGPEALFSTARTASISTDDELAASIAALHAEAGSRGDGLDVAVPYIDPSVHDPGTDWGKHRAAISALGEAGATWVIVPGQAGPPAETTGFLERFGKEVARS